MKIVSRFEYAITKHIHENISPQNMDEIRPRTNAEETQLRKENIERQLKRLRINQ